MDWEKGCEPSGRSSKRGEAFSGDCSGHGVSGQERGCEKVEARNGGTFGGFDDECTLGAG